MILQDKTNIMSFCVLKQSPTIFTMIVLVYFHTTTSAAHGNKISELPTIQRQRIGRNVFGFGSFILKQSLSNKSPHPVEGKKEFEENLRIIPHKDKLSLIRQLRTIGRDYLFRLQAMAEMKRSEPPIGMWGRDTSFSRRPKYKNSVNGVSEEDLKNKKNMNEKEEYNVMNHKHSTKREMVKMKKILDILMML